MILCQLHIHSSEVWGLGFIYCDDVYLMCGQQLNIWGLTQGILQISYILIVKKHALLSTAKCRVVAAST